jgi:beta-phosphoglucomutase
MLSAVIFDMDGVLIDSHGAHRAAWRSFNEALNNPITEKDLDFVLDGRKREEILFHFLGELSPQKLAEFGRLKDSFLEQQIDEIQPLPGLRVFLQALTEEKIPLAVATSANAQRTKNMLSRLHLEDFFGVIVTGSEVTKGKPDPAVFMLAAERMGVSPAEVLVIEDAVAGVEGALQAGMRCVGIAEGPRIEIMRTAGAELVFRDFTGLSVPWLKKWFSPTLNYASTRTAL